MEERRESENSGKELRRERDNVSVTLFYCPTIL